MAAPNQIYDGSPVYGTPVITINSTTYTAEDIKIERPMARAEDETLVGLPNRMRLTAQRNSGTMTLQAPAGTSGRPKRGDTFTLTTDDNFGAENWVLEEVGYESSNPPGNLRKMPVKFLQVVNAITTA